MQQVSGHLIYIHASDIYAHCFWMRGSLYLLWRQLLASVTDRRMAVSNVANGLDAPQVEKRLQCGSGSSDMVPRPAWLQSAAPEGGSGPQPVAPLLGVIRSPQLEGYRNKLEMDIVLDEQGKPVVGFGAVSHFILFRSIAACRLPWRRFCWSCSHVFGFFCLYMFVFVLACCM
jgi:hypothetical protein